MCNNIMYMTYTTKTRKRLNFMIDENILKGLNSLIPAGQKSNFINEAIEEKIIKYGKQKAFESIEIIRSNLKLNMNTKEILKAIKDGRRY